MATQHLNAAAESIPRVKSDRRSIQFFLQERTGRYVILCSEMIGS